MLKIMKRIKAMFLSSIVLLFCNSIYANETSVEIYSGNDNDNMVKDDRSLSFMPTVTIDGTTLRIYSDVAVEYVSVVVKTLSGDMVYSAVDATASRCHTFELHTLAEGDYLLEIYLGDVFFYGSLSID